MKRFSIIRVIVSVCLLGGFFQSQPPAPAVAAPVLRAQVYQHGDFALIGNSFGYDCGPGTPLPVVGTVGACGTDTVDSAADIFWQADYPAPGKATADNTIPNTRASSTAVLNLPDGAQVTHAFLYWSATLAVSGAAGTSATLSWVGTGAFSQPVQAVDWITGANNSYRSVADVTALVQAHGSGAYKVSDVDIVNWVNLNDPNPFAGWWMVVFYKLSSAPLRQLTLYDGLDPVTYDFPQNFTFSGFTLPYAVGASKLGVAAMGGDNSITGDALSMMGNPLSDAQNPANNFFNGTRSTLGAATSVAGDLPQMSGGPQSMTGMDLDIVDITPNLLAGMTAFSISATTDMDVYYLTTLVTSIPTDVRVLSFTAASPSASWNIPITAFTTTGIGTAYLITQSGIPPTADDPNWSASIPTSYTVGGDGTYTLYPWFKDESGSISSRDPIPFATVVVDTTPPDTTITAHPPSVTSSTSASFSYTGSDSAGSGTGVKRFECALDSSSFGGCLSNYTGLGEGSHTFQVRAVDGAGNVDSSPAAYTWTVDRTGPSVTINQAEGQADPSFDSPITFRVVFSEPVTGFATGGVTLTGSAGATSAVVSEDAPNDGTTYTVAVSGMTMSGTVSAAIQAGAAQDLAANASSASTSSDNVVNFVYVRNTTTTITAHTADPSVVGEPVAIHYAVTAIGPGSGSPSGSVTVTDGTNSCTDTVSAGFCTITFTSPGDRTLTASYEGDAAFKPSSSTGDHHMVNPASTTTLLTVSASLNEPACLSAAVSINAPGAGTLSGSVSFYDGDHLLGMSALDASGVAQLCPVTIPGGERSLKAVYAGNSNIAASQQTVTALIPWHLFFGWTGR